MLLKRPTTASAHVRQRYWNIGGGVAGRAPKTRESSRRIGGEGVGSRKGDQKFLVIMRSLLIWVGVNRTTSCEKSVNKSVIMPEKLRGALQMKMTATCGIQKFRWREKIKHLSKYWGVVNTRRPLQVKYWGVATPATPVDAYASAFSILGNVTKLFTRSEVNEGMNERIKRSADK